MSGWGAGSSSACGRGDGFVLIQSLAFLAEPAAPLTNPAVSGLGLPVEFCPEPLLKPVVLAPVAPMECCTPSPPAKACRCPHLMTCAWTSESPPPASLAHFRMFSLK